MASYADYGTPKQRFIEEQAITVTTDGATVEQYSLPGRPLTEFAFSVSFRNGQRTIGVGPIGLKTVAAPVTAEGMAKSNAHRARLAAHGCVDPNRTERLLYHERLLERWDAVVVQRPESLYGQHQVHSHVWRIPALNCQQVQFESQTEKDGAPLGKTCTKLISLELINTTSDSFTGQLAELKEVSPSTLYKSFAEHVGHAPCTTCERRFNKMDQAYEAMKRQ